jgi:ERCC4-related helicase
VPEAWTEHALALPRVPPAASDLIQEIHLAAIEYALANPITIRDRDDIQSAKHWADHFEPFEHQVRNLITFCRRAPVALIADEVGLGKTISAGLILSELMTRKRIQRALVVCPKILLRQWQEELRTKFRIRSSFETGKSIKHLVDSNVPVVLTTYETARDHMDSLRDGRFGLLILDEAHKLRNLYGTANPPKTARVIHGALRERLFPFVLMLTATPIQNRLWDLYSLVTCLTAASQHDNPFGTPQTFASRFLADAPTIGQKLKPTMKAEFRRRLGGYLVRTSKHGSGLLFPERIATTVPSPAGNVEAEMRSIVADVLPTLNGLSQVSVAEAMMSSPAALARQLENMAEKGTVERDVAREARSLAASAPTGAKMPVLLAMASDLRRRAGPSWRLVVFTRRKESQVVIGKALEADGARVGYIRGGQASENAAAIAAFWADPPEVNVLVSTDAGAEGVNLQVANVVVNYDLPWNPMVVEQRIGRVQRLASPFKHVSVANLVVAGSVEERVVARLMVRLQAVSDTLGDVEAILEAVGSGDEESIEKDLRELVIRALMGQDVDAAAAAIEAAIEGAKQLYDQERTTVEDTLGKLDAMHDAGPELPDLAPVTPRMAVPTFVRHAFEAGGAVVVPDESGRLRIQRPGHPMTIATFDEDDPDLLKAQSTVGFGGKWIDVYLPGRPAFEQLVGAWAQQRCHRTLDARKAASSDPSAIVNAWLEENDCSLKLERLEVRRQDPRFRGTATFVASAGVAHDRFERLVEVPVGSWTEDESACSTAPYVSDEIFLPEFEDHDPDEVRQFIDAQPDLKRFAQFYRARRDEQLATTHDPKLRVAIEDRFTPQFAAELQAVRGELVERASVRLQFSVDGRGSYPADLVLDAGRVVGAPESGTCHQTGTRVPVTALESCAIGGEAVLAHLLVRSDLSGRGALASRTRRCGVSGRTLLEDEVRTSDASGIVAAADLFGRCAVTNGNALRTELARCDATGALVLPTELVVSDVSGRRVRRDQARRSTHLGRLGHESEMAVCAITGAWLTPDETGTSDVSGIVVHAPLLIASERTPSRCGVEAETVRCAVSGKTLLVDEVVKSAISGSPADPDLLVESDVSGRKGLPTEVERCEESDARALVDEIAVCAETGRRVRVDLLAKNDFTNQPMLARVLRSCPETGKRGRERDLVRCEVTDVLVDPAALTQCTESGRRALLRLMVRCDECGAPLLESAATVTARGKRAHAVHVAQCAWTGEPHLVSELAECSITGMRVRADLLDSSGIARVLAQLRDRVSARAPDDGALRGTVLAALPDGMRVGRVWGKHNGDGTLLAFIGERSTFFGLSRRHFGGFVDLRLRTVVGEVGPVA